MRFNFKALLFVILSSFILAPLVSVSPASAVDVNVSGTMTIWRDVNYLNNAQTYDLNMGIYDTSTDILVGGLRSVKATAQVGSNVGASEPAMFGNIDLPPGTYMICTTYGSISLGCSEETFSPTTPGAEFSINDKAGINNELALDDSLVDVAAPPPIPADKRTCGNTMSLIGWIACPVINTVAVANDGMWAIVKSLLFVNPLASDSSNSIYKAWGVMRNLANIVFVIVFLIMIFSQMSSAGMSNYGIKKLLPRLIIGAILVNASYIIVQILVDLANITGKSLYEVMLGIQPEVAFSWGSLVVQFLLAGFTLGAGVVIAFSPALPAVLLMLLPIVVAGFLALIAALLTLIVRQALIPILAIVAPLAFVAYLLPNTETFYRKWQSMLLSMLMLYPIAALVFGGSQFVAIAIVSQGGTFNLLIGLVIMVMPLFSLPWLATQGGSIVGKVGGSLQGLAEKGAKTFDNYSKPYQDKAKAKYLADNPRGRLQTYVQGVSHNAKTRQVDTDTHRKRAATAWYKTPAGMRAISRSNRADIETGKDKSKASTRMKTVHSDKVLSGEAAQAEETAAGAKIKADATEAASERPNAVLDQLMTPETRRSFQESQRNTNDEGLRAESAQGVIREENMKRLMETDPITGDPSQAAVRAAGIDNLNSQSNLSNLDSRGITRVLAKAQGEANRITNDEIAGRIASISNRQGVNASNLLQTATNELHACLANNDVVGTRAAMQILYSSGATGRDAIHQQIATHERGIPGGGPATSDASNAARAEILLHDPSTSDHSLGAWAHSDNHPVTGRANTLANIEGTAGTYSNLTYEQLATQDFPAFQRAQSAITPGVAAEMINDRAVYQKLSRQKKDIVHTISRIPRPY